MPINEITLNGHQIPIMGKVQERQVNPWAPRISSGSPDFGNYSAAEMKVYGDIRGGMGIEEETSDSTDKYYYADGVDTAKAHYWCLAPLNQTPQEGSIAMTGKRWVDFESKILMFGNGGSYVYTEPSNTADASVPLVATRLLGSEGATTGVNGAGYQIYTKWTAIASGNVTHIKIQCSGAGNVKVALLSDNANAPGTVLASNVTGTGVAAGWNSIAVTPVAVVSGTAYWFAFVADALIVYYQQVTTAQEFRYKTATYSTFTSFTNNPTGLTSSTLYNNAIAGYLLADSTVTAVTNNGATNTTGTTAIINGYLQCDGGHDTTVTVYYGLTDGVTTVANWTNSYSVGAKATGQTFTAPVTGLAEGGAYYYRCSATNTDGTVWAAASGTFTSISTKTWSDTWDTGLSSVSDALVIRDSTDSYVCICNGSDIRYAAAPSTTTPIVLYAGEAVWTRSADAIDVTCTADTSIFKLGNASSKMACTDTLGVENIAYYDTGTLDISAMKYIHLWIYSSVALSANDLQVIVGTNTALGGTTEAYNIPAVSAATWTRAVVTITTPASFASLDSIGIKQAVDKGAFNLYVDKIVATANDWATLSTSDVKYMCAYDHRLCGVDATGSTFFESAQNNIDANVGGALPTTFAMSGMWTTVYDLFTGLMPVTSVETVFMITDIGLVSIDTATKTAEPMDIRFPKPTSGVPMIGLYYNGDILVSYGTGIKRISAGGIVTEWGLNQDDGYPSALQGYIYDMIAPSDWVYVTVVNTTDKKSYIYKRHNTLGGWHNVATLSGEYKSLHYSNTTTPSTLWTSDEDTTSATYQTYYYEIPDKSGNVAQTSGYKFVDTSNSDRKLYLPKFSKLSPIQKIALAVEATTKNCSATDYISIYYRVNDSSTSTLLGTFTSSPSPTVLTFASGAGVSFYNIAFEVMFTRASASYTVSPVLKSLVLKYVIRPVYIGGWTFNVDSTGADVKQWVDWINDARDNTTLVNFSPIGDTSKLNYYVKVQQCPSKFEAMSPDPARLLTVSVAEAV